MTEQIYYEQPLNEKIRVFLRLEFLFNQLNHHLQTNSVWDSHAALNSIFALLVIFNRADLKMELIKELEYYSQYLKKMATDPNVDSNRLNQILNQFEQLLSHFHQLPGRIGQSLRQHEFIKNVMQRSAIPAASCSFDLPAYHYWCQYADEQRQQTILDWMEHFNQAQQAIKQMLHILRSCAAVSTQQAKQGCFQQQCQKEYQLIRIALPINSPFYTEISADKRNINLRFLSFDLEQPSIKTEQTVDFQLVLCGF